MEEFKKNKLAILGLITFFVIMTAGVFWGIKSAINTEISLPANKISKNESNEIENVNYIRIDKAEQGIDFQLKTKDPFKINFPTSLTKPINISLANNHVIEITQKDGEDFATLTKNQEIKTAENSKLLSVIQKEKNITTYRNANGDLVFYNYQKINNEKKQNIFKNWILYNTPTEQATRISAYEIKNALVNIDSSGDAQVFFNDSKEAIKKSPDFTIPKPYFLDKDTNKTELDWKFDQDSKILSVSFTAEKQQYPIALDPSVLKTDTTIATFSGKSLSMSAYFACGTTAVDYGGKSYPTVQIGSQCWFRENLNVGTMLDAGTTMPSDPAPTINEPTTVQKWCYGNDLNKCNTEGGLYTWAEANALSSTCNTTTCTPTTPNQGICPEGWHIPTDQEFITLEEYLGMCSGTTTGCSGATGWRGTDQGTQMKTISASTFSGRLAGGRGTDGSFNRFGSNTDFWSVSPASTTNAWSRSLYSSNATVSRYNYPKASGVSVRCLKN